MFLVVAGLALPATSRAAPPSAEREALAAFEAGFSAGQDLFDRGDYRGAARTWVDTAEHLPESSTNRSNRVAVYQYIADAFTRGLADSREPDAIREAASALDAYCEQFVRVHGSVDELSPKIVAARDDFHRRLAELEAPPPVPPGAPVEVRDVRDSPPAGRAPRAWRGPQVTGGVLLGLGGVTLVAAVVGAVRGASLQQQFDDPRRLCVLNQPSAPCAEILSQGERMNALAYGGAILSPLLVGGGIALIIVASRRRAANLRESALAPRFGGLTWRF